ncbi:MAG: energy-coupling factor ABC transporter ATP-binding protein [Thermoproteus sp.]
MAVRVEDLWVELDGRPVLRGASAEFRGPSLLMGPNGSGKTVLLHTIVGILKPKRGRVETQGVLSIMFQDPEVHFVAGTVLENALLWSNGRSTEAEIKELAGGLGIADLLDSPPFLLSWGQKKLAALLCALARRPDVLLLDELPEGLSPKALKAALRVALEAAETIIMTSHQFLELGWSFYFLDGGLLYSGQEALKKAEEEGYGNCKCGL